MAQLGGVHKSLSRENRQSMLACAEKLIADLNKILKDVEETLWYQKSRTKWIEQGDCNTKFHHTITIVQQNRNTIHALKMENGDWCSDINSIQNCVISYFKNLFTAPNNYANYVASDEFHSLHRLDAENMYKPIDIKETWEALKSMVDLKAPRPDGFHAIFFKKCWNTVGEKIHKMVSNAFQMQRSILTSMRPLLFLSQRRTIPKALRSLGLSQCAMQRTKYWPKLLSIESSTFQRISSVPPKPVLFLIATLQTTFLWLKNLFIICGTRRLKIEDWL